MRKLATFGLLAGAAGCATGQQATIERVTTRLVEVHVAVRDRHGVPVRGLSREDFTVTENGRPQPVRVFAAGDAPAPAANLPGLPPGAVSNRTGIGGGATVLLLDALNTPPLYGERARPHVAAFLGAVAPRERIAVYVLRSDLAAIVDFTTDTAMLLKTLQAYRSRRKNPGKDTLEAETRLLNLDPLTGNPGWGGNPAGAMQALLGKSGDFRDLAASLLLFSLGNQSREMTVDTVRFTCDALRAIANRVRGIPGRKNLVWVTTGFPLLLGRLSFSSDFERVVRDLNDAAVAVYPVDARGLMALSRGLTDDGAAMLRQLAERTGGRSFRGEELGEAGIGIVEDTQASYTLGYYPDNRELDGKFRRIQVRVNRPGVTVRHRTGYFASPEEAAEKSAVAAAVWNPLDATGLALDTWLEAGVIHVRLHGAKLPVEPKAGRYACRLQLVFVQTDAAGKQVAGVEDNAEFLLTNPENGLEYRKPLEIHAQAAAVRVVVRSLSTGALGSVKLPLTR